MRGPEDLDPAILQLKSDSRRRYLVEQCIQGRELTCGVWDDGSGPQVLPCTEIRFEEGRTFDFEGKYLGQGTQEITPAEIEPDCTSAIQTMALKAHRALGCSGYSRTDVMVDAQGPVFLELNTLPGVTAASLIPQQLEAERGVDGDLRRSPIEARPSRDRRGQIPGRICSATGSLKDPRSVCPIDYSKLMRAMG